MLAWALGRAWLSEPAAELDMIRMTFRRTDGSESRPYPRQPPANYPVSGFPLWFVSIVVVPSFSPQIGELSLKPIRCIGIIDVRTFRRCGKLYEINFATCTRELAGRAGCQSVAKD